MIPRSISFLIAILVILIESICCRDNSLNTIDFEFDVKNLDNNQRNRLFGVLDTNRNNLLSKNEFKPLLRKLFYSTKLNRTLVNDSNEENIFSALNLTSIDSQMGRDEFNQLWNDWIKVILKPRSALIVVDVQNDFMNGSLTVPNGTDVIPVINELIQGKHFDLVVYTKDWHPFDHCSFVESARNESNGRKIIKMTAKSISQLTSNDTVFYKKYPDTPQKLWPRHCVKNEWGSQLYPALSKAENSIEIVKGTNPDIDSYSAFQDNNGLHPTQLNKGLQDRDITDVYLSGVLYEFCVGRTALDALKLGYRTAFVEDAIQTANPDARDQMRHNLTEKSANIIRSDDVSDMVSGRERTVQMGIVLAKKLYKNH